MPPYRSGRRRSKRTISVVPVRPWIAGSEDSHPAHTLDVESRRFPHIIVAVGKGEPDFVENSWVGLNVEISETLLLVTNPCDRCVMTNLPQADLPQDHGILRTGSAAQPALRSGSGRGDAQRWSIRECFTSGQRLSGRSCTSATSGRRSVMS
jgi:hypothetical protein